jgi:hypothetical protein
VIEKRPEENQTRRSVKKKDKKAKRERTTTTKVTNRHAFSDVDGIAHRADLPKEKKRQLWSKPASL